MIMGRSENQKATIATPRVGDATYPLPELRPQGRGLLKAQTFPARRTAGQEGRVWRTEGRGVGTRRLSAGGGDAERGLILSR